jgi:hypothetical protein
MTFKLKFNYKTNFFNILSSCLILELVLQTNSIVINSSTPTTVYEPAVNTCLRAASSTGSSARQNVKNAQLNGNYNAPIFGQNS